MLKNVKSEIHLISSTKMCIDYHEDQSPVLAARVSHGRDGKTGEDLSRDIKLTKFLADNKHTTPFEHLSVTFKVICPLFVAREWMRHRTQSYNEISMRYTSDPVGKMWFPDVWRKQSSKNHQSSTGEVDRQEDATEVLAEVYRACVDGYNKLLTMNVCREQARAAIPVGNTTEFYATANLLNWSKFCRLRCAEDAQFEIRVLADQISDICKELYPVSWEALNG